LCSCATACSTAKCSLACGDDRVVAFPASDGDAQLRSGRSVPASVERAERRACVGRCARLVVAIVVSFCSGHRVEVLLGANADGRIRLAVSWAAVVAGSLLR
jgi:hypothetical protein